MVSMNLRTLFPNYFGFLTEQSGKVTCVPLARLLQTDRRWSLWWWCTIAVRPSTSSGEGALAVEKEEESGLWISHIREKDRKTLAEIQSFSPI